ncbi:MAG: beta-ketoacyl-[acyl-carrier-protein] synthase family protein [Gemmataceae bacterium]
MTTPIWITGVGVGTPLGFRFAELADNLIAGRSGVTSITCFDASRHKCRVAAPLAPVPTPTGRDAHAFAQLLPLDRLTLWCATTALADAGWTDLGSRLGIALGSGAEWLPFWERDAAAGGSLVREPRPESDCTLHTLRRELAHTGPAVTVGAACASANYAFGVARRWVASGWVDACLVGGVDRSLTPVGLACFANLGALTSRNDAPTAASRPFDRGRDGFVLGEGGALFVVESAASARRRGAKPYAELAGCGTSGDAYHMVTPRPDPTYAARAMRAALADAGINPGDVDYINAHATSTPLGDVGEARALRLVFGNATVPVSSTKGMTGHLISGASAVEAVACLAAIERSALPPTINLDDPDPECELCHVANVAQERCVDVAVSNSFGFGGSNSCIVLRKVA